MSDYPVYDAILSRRSIRHFLDKPVPRGHVEMLLKAAMAAPSACNLQPWAFIVVNEPETLTRLKDCMDQGKYNAPLAVIVCGINKHIPWTDEGWRQDCGGAAQNMMIECVELGLASVCIGGFDADALCALLKIPDDVFPMCIVEIGYPACERPPLTWYTQEAVHWQAYDAEKPRIFRTMRMLEEDIASGKM